MKKTAVFFIVLSILLSGCSQKFHVLKGNGYANANHYTDIDYYSNRYPYPNKYSNSNENRDTDTYINTFGERHRETGLCKDLEQPKKEDGEPMYVSNIYSYDL